MAWNTRKIVVNWLKLLKYIVYKSRFFSHKFRINQRHAWRLITFVEGTISRNQPIVPLIFVSMSHVISGRRLMMDLTLSQIAVSRRTMFVYFLYDEKHCNTPRRAIGIYARNT